MSSIMNDNSQNKQLPHRAWFKCHAKNRSCPKPSIPIKNTPTQNAGKMKCSRFIQNAFVYHTHHLSRFIIIVEPVNIYGRREGAPGGYGKPLRNTFY